MNDKIRKRDRQTDGQIAASLYAPTVTNISVDADGPRDAASRSIDICAIYTELDNVCEQLSDDYVDGWWHWPVTSAVVVRCCR